LGRGRFAGLAGDQWKSAGHQWGEGAGLTVTQGWILVVEVGVLALVALVGLLRK